MKTIDADRVVEASKAVGFESFPKLPHGWRVSVIEHWWSTSVDPKRWALALALGVLPDGWRKLTGLAAFGHAGSGVYADWAVRAVFGVYENTIAESEMGVRIVSAVGYLRERDLFNPEDYREDRDEALRP